MECNHQIFLPKNEYVILRTYASGVHVGILNDYDFHTHHALLNQARRLWEWEGAFTLSEVANGGVISATLSEELPTFIVANVEEIIPCSKIAEKFLRETPTYVWSE